MRPGSSIRLEPLGEAHRRAVGAIHPRLRFLILEGVTVDELREPGNERGGIYAIDAGA